MPAGRDGQDELVSSGGEEATVSSRPTVRGLRRVDLLTSDLVAAAVFYRELLDWSAAVTRAGIDCWVGERRCATIRSPRAGEPAGWRLVFAGAAHDGTLTGPDDTTALMARGRAQHGPWAPGPRPGEPCWVELRTSDPNRADAFWADILNWTVRTEQPGVDYVVGDRPLASRTEGQPTGWLCYFAVEDVTDAADRVARLGGTLAERIDHPLLGDALLVRDPSDALVGLTTATSWGG
ncbi:hypothetical protein GCM10011581_36750 [Saccharopolyspora subtropica]|uniref:VOC domain-containing protein n=1 Tax=Saccharopolyspora thermophila TaxID=89367 RepID=A0A917K3X0_9PSEU|nr:hypothetical protein GCM10011581_36750 [Saccharopolyspora subtropica]